MKSICAILLALMTAASLCCVCAGAEPDFGPNVLIFDPSMKNIQTQISAIATKQKDAQFSDARYAYLFKPGTYNIDVQVGYYVQVLGLGQTPDAVAITGGISSNSTLPKNNVTCAFWRAVENLSFTGKDFGWALSQGTDLRRIHAHGDVSLSTGGWASGGFIADCKIAGKLDGGTQQQWFTRNSDVGTCTGGAWNMVYIGVPNAPAKWPINTAIDKTPLIAEKPYLFIDNAGHYSVMVPALRKESAGTSFSSGTTAGKTISIEAFYIAHPEKDNAASINAALAGGKNLLLTPGIYHLEESINVTRPDTIVLGIGYATLIPDKGTLAIRVADVDGVKVGGLILQASTADSPTLLQVGDAKSTKSHAADPTVIYDIFTRVGGAGPGSADVMLTINSNDVIGDNAWLWRADHGAGHGWNEAKNKNGLVVNGDDVIYYGLAVEHTQEYQTLWNGNGGRVYFYQSEMPYDVPPGVKGYASYKLGDSVTTHEAWGVGIYCYFLKAPVIVENDIETPTAAGIKFHHMIHLKLGALGGISHIINGAGSPAVPDHTAVDLNEWP
jgi:hypothetical protein